MGAMLFQKFRKFPLDAQINLLNTEHIHIKIYYRLGKSVLTQIPDIIPFSDF